MAVVLVTYRDKSGRKRTVRARRVEHVHQGPTLYVHAIPEDDPGGEKTIRVKPEDLGRMEKEGHGDLMVSQYSDASGRLYGSSMHLNTHGEWELMTDFGPEKVRKFWRSVY